MTFYLYTCYCDVKMKKNGIKFKFTYLCGTELWSPSLKLSDRCKHVHAVVHVDLLIQLNTAQKTPHSEAPSLYEDINESSHHIARRKLLLHDCNPMSYVLLDAHLNRDILTKSWT